MVMWKRKLNSKYSWYTPFCVCNSVDENENSLMWVDHICVLTLECSISLRVAVTVLAKITKRLSWHLAVCYHHLFSFQWCEHNMLFDLAHSSICIKILRQTNIKTVPSSQRFWVLAPVSLAHAIPFRVPCTQEMKIKTAEISTWRQSK